ncbi:MAG: zinc-dependent metalloprotease [Chloroflexota bacterium]
MSAAALATRGSLARGAVVAGAVAVGWALARRLTRDTDRRLIDWERAAFVATRVAGSHGRLQGARHAALQLEYETMVREIEQPLAAYTGTQLSLAQTEVQVLDRVGWIHANIKSFKQLFQPLEDLYQEQWREAANSLPGASQAARLVLSGEVGVILGYLSRKVLGQYDISLLGTEPLESGKLYFVQPNIEELERTLGMPPAEVRRWIALHEATHAHEFEVYPWVRSYLNGQLDSYLRGMARELLGHGASPSLLLRLAQNLSRGHSLIDAVMTPHQRALLARMQSLMTLAEGYSNHVMNKVGAELLEHHEEIHHRVEHRQKNRGRAELLFLQLTGLKMKMEQYALGEQFANEVADRKGVAFLNRAWHAAENLPTDEEYRDAARWISRMEAAV